ncbi:MAG TPA: hypothetical protein VIN03_23690 [Roseateles sp.]
MMLLAGGVAWLCGHSWASRASLALQPIQPSAAPAEAATAAAMAQPPASAANALAPPGRPSVSFFPPKDVPGEALRKVQLALNGGSAVDALRAAHVLADCAQASQVVDALFTVRDQRREVPDAVRQIVDDPGGVTQEKIEQAQHEQRRCQVFDAGTLARRGELFQKAYEGGAQGSALSYLQWLQSPDDLSGRAGRKGDPALLARLQAEVRSAAESGDMSVLPVLAFATGDTGRQLGISPTQQQAFKEAWLLVLVDGVPGNVAQLRKAIDAQFAPSAPLTSAQQSEADALTKRVFDAWRRSNRR